MTRFHDGGVNQQVVVNEFCRPGAVGEDAADGSGDEVDGIGAVDAEPLVDCGLIAQVEVWRVAVSGVTPSFSDA